MKPSGTLVKGARRARPAPPHAAADSLGSRVAPARGGLAPSAKGRSGRVNGARMAAVPADEEPVRKPGPTDQEKEAARVTRKKGTKLPPVLIAVEKSIKEVEWRKGEYAVFMDRHSYSCIRVGTGSVVEYIPMTAKIIDVNRADARRFADHWKPYLYPIRRAAEIYAEGAKSRGITELARSHLSEILGRPLDHLKPVSDEELMAAKQKRKDEKAARKAAKEAEVTVTTVKDGEKTVVRTTKVPKPDKGDAKVKIMSREDAAKAIKAGGKLKPGRDNDTRKGSLRATAIDAIRACKDVAAALKAKFKWKGAHQLVKFTDVRSAVRRGYVVITKK